MAALLSQGANISVDADRVSVVLEWQGADGAVEGSAYLLTASGKVTSDADMVFYNQPEGAGGAVKLVESQPLTFEVTLDQLPSHYERIVFCVTADGSSAKNLSALERLMLRVEAAGQGDLATFSPDMSVASEAAMMVGELYLRAGKWKVRAVAQGFNGGLAPLARSFGIDVSEPAAPANPEPTAVPVRVNLSKITLEKSKPTVSLEKRGDSFGEIIVNLNWSTAPTGLFVKSAAVDLDLGCLYELKNGKKGIVQALGSTFGHYGSSPFIELSGDDRTGAVSTGETIRINGSKWAEIDRIALFTYIYEGAINWSSTNGFVTITMPDQPPIEIVMTDGENSRIFCGLAVIENVGGTMKFTRLVEYFQGHRDFDQRVGWGMQWRVGTKS